MIFYMIDITYFILFFVIGVLVFTFLAIFFYKKSVKRIKKISDDQLKDFFRSVIQIVDFDRERISNDVHDEVGTILSIIKLNLTKAYRNPGDSKQSQKLLEETLVLLENAIQHTRDISKELMSPTLLKLGYEQGITELCRQIDASNEIKVFVTGSDNEVRMLPIHELQLYRILQEIFNNIIKHANATEIKVRMKSDEQAVLTEIKHNGIGLTSEKAKTLSETADGVGLKSIHKRLELMDASIDYITDGRGESAIIVNVPNYEKEN